MPVQISKTGKYCRLKLYKWCQHLLILWKSEAGIVVVLQSQIIKLMLCVKPEDRPEASTLKTELKEQAHALYPLKNMPRNNNSV